MLGSLDVPLDFYKLSLYRYAITLWGKSPLREQESVLSFIEINIKFKGAKLKSNTDCATESMCGSVRDNLAESFTDRLV